MAAGAQSKLVSLYQPNTSSQDKWPQQDLDDGLVHAAFLGNLQLVQWFLSRGSQVHYWQDPMCDQYEDCSMEFHTFKSSALLAACQQGHLDIAIFLQKATGSQAKPQNVREGLFNCNYWAILVETLKNRNRILGKNTAQDDDDQDINLDIDPFLQPFCFLENLPLLRYLIDCGADLSVRGQSGKTPLMKAAGSKRYASALEVLLQAGADPNLISRQHHSALVCATRSRNIGAMKKLLEYGACLEQLTQEYTLTDADGEVKVLGTACHALVYCVALGYLPETKLLIQWGARPSLIPRFLLYVHNLLDTNDLTSYTDCISYLHLAFYRCQPEIARYLLEINFLSPQDMWALRGDKDLLRHLIAEQEDEAEAQDDLAGGFDVNMNHRVGLVSQGVNASLNGASTDNTTRQLPALRSLSIFKDFSHQPPSLFSLSVMCVRHTCGTDSWTQHQDTDNSGSSLGLPKPLMKSILYGSTWQSQQPM